MLHVGMVGCGGIADQHLDGFVLLKSQATVTAVCDVDPARAARAAARVGGARCYATIEEIVHDPNVDAIDICLPHHLHAGAILAAAQAGKHVLCEKPLCTTHAEAKSIREAIAASNITLMCAHNQLFEPAIPHAKEIIEAGRLGQIYMARTQDCFWSHSTDWGWRGARATAGGGELIDTGYHPTYTLLYLMSLAGLKPVEVASMQGRYRQAALEGEDTAHVMVRFDSGAIGQILTSWAFELPAGSHSFHMIGELGELYGSENQCTFQANGAAPEQFIGEPLNSYHAELPHFVDAIEHGSRPIQNHEDGIAVLDLILAAYQSESEHRMIALG